MGGGRKMSGPAQEIVYDHPALGRVAVRRSVRAATARACWRDGIVRLTVPARMALSEDSIAKILDELAPRLLACRREITFSDGQTISVPGVDIVIRSNPRLPEGLVITAAQPVSCVELGGGLEVGSPEMAPRISDAVRAIAARLAESMLLPRAREIAGMLGSSPLGWDIGRGHRVMGTCSSRGIIRLSSLLVLAPQTLRDYVVCHELAHLVELNHSPRFHEVCERYCRAVLGRPEAAVMAAVRTYRWPVYI